MANLIWLGALLGVLASMFAPASKQLMRFSEIQRLKDTPASLRLAKVSLGIGLGLNIVVGPLIDASSYACAPQSIIAPLGGLGVCWNTLSAPCTLGETLTRTLIAGCFLIAAGATATSIFGSKAEKDYTIELLQDTLFRWEVLLYMLTLCAWLAFNILVLVPRSAAPKGEPFKTGDKLRGFSLATTAGSIAGNVFCVKGFVEILQGSIRDGKPEYWAHWLPYVLLVGAVLFATSNLYFLTKAMKEYEVLFMGAVFEGSGIVSACISGCVVFDEMKGLQWHEIVLYWLAVGSIVGGIVTVAYDRMGNKAFTAQHSQHSQVYEKESAADPTDGQQSASDFADCSVADVDGQPVLAENTSKDTSKERETVPCRSERKTSSNPSRVVPFAVDLVLEGSKQVGTTPDGDAETVKAEVAVATGAAWN